jgi:hypothetical protein
LEGSVKSYETRQMQTEIELAFVKKFVKKDKQERYLGFLSNEKTRSKFTNELHYFKDFEWDLFNEVRGLDRDAIIARIKDEKEISKCHVVSYRPEYDGKSYSIEDAINLVGTEEIILIFGNADVVYYEGEAPGNRYISI